MFLSTTAEMLFCSVKWKTKAVKWKHIHLLQVLIQKQTNKN